MSRDQFLEIKEKTSGDLSLLQKALNGNPDDICAFAKTCNDKEALAWYEKAAEQNHAVACFEAGDIYRGSSKPQESKDCIPPDPEKAFAFIKKSAELNYTEAQYFLANFYVEYYGCKNLTRDQTLKEAIDWFTEATTGDRPSGDACFSLAMHYFLGWGVAKNIETAMGFFHRAVALEVEEAKILSETINASCQDAEAQLENSREDKETIKRELGNFRTQKTLYLLKNTFNALREETEKFARKNLILLRGGQHIVSQVVLCYFYMEGRGGPNDLNQAHQLLCEIFQNVGTQKLCAEIETILDQAQQTLAQHLLLNQDNADLIKKREEQTYQLYSAAAKRNPRALMKVGVCKALGFGTGISEFAAFQAFEASWSQGCFSALIHLGICYETGFGVDKNPIQAVICYQKAAKENYSRAKTHLGLCFLNGGGVVRNLATGLKYIQAAAEERCALAQDILATLIISANHEDRLSYGGQTVDLKKDLHYADSLLSQASKTNPLAVIHRLGMDMVRQRKSLDEFIVDLKNLKSDPAPEPSSQAFIQRKDDGFVFRTSYLTFAYLQNYLGVCYTRKKLNAVAELKKIKAEAEQKILSPEAEQKKLIAAAEEKIFKNLSSFHFLQAAQYGSLHAVVNLATEEARYKDLSPKQIDLLRQILKSGKILNYDPGIHVTLAAHYQRGFPGQLANPVLAKNLIREACLRGYNGELPDDLFKPLHLKKATLPTTPFRLASQIMFEPSICVASEFCLSLINDDIRSPKVRLKAKPKNLRKKTKKIPAKLPDQTLHETKEDDRSSVEPDADESDEGGVFCY